MLYSCSLTDRQSELCGVSEMHGLLVQSDVVARYNLLASTMMVPALALWSFRLLVFLAHP